jgi:hypothetical protein
MRRKYYNGFQIHVGAHSVVSIATRHGLEDARIEPRWGRGFPHSSRPAPGPTQTFLRWELGLFPPGKATGA